MRPYLALALTLCLPLITGCKPYAVQLFVRDVPAPEVDRVEAALTRADLEVIRNEGSTPLVAAPTVVYFPGRKSIRAANRSADVLENLGYENVRVEPFHIDNHEYSQKTIGIYLRTSITPGDGQALPGVQRASFSAGCDSHDIFLTLVDDSSFQLAIESGFDSTTVDVREGQWQTIDDEIRLSSVSFTASLTAGTSSVENIFSPGLVRQLEVVASTEPVFGSCRRTLRRLMER